MQSSNTARRHLALVATSNGALPRYLFKRNGAYYFKRKIPHVATAVLREVVRPLDVLPTP